MMKKSLLVLIVLFYFVPDLHAQNYYFTAPEGFGAETTGGGSATPVTVTTYADLKSKLSASGAAVILVSGTITIPNGGVISVVVKDKTLLGLPGAKLLSNDQTQSGSGIMNLKDGSTNVIIRNLIFESPGAYDTDGRDNLTADGCTRLWVDHCEFRDGVDGNYDNKGRTDNVTISWCKFTYLKPPKAGGSGGSDDHRYTNLVGSSKSDAPADGHYSITFQNCYWAEGCNQRMPRARNAELHILNCYYNTSVSNSLALGLGGGHKNLTCYVENTDFAKIARVYQNYSGDGGTVDLTFVNCLKGTSNVGAVSKPTYAYSVLPVTDVSKYIPNETCGAGATLQVATDGTISIAESCTVVIPETFDLTIEKTGTGTGKVSVSPVGFEIGAGTDVTLTATADEGSTFTGWSNGLSGTENPATVTINGDITVVAEFTKDAEPALGIYQRGLAGLIFYPNPVDDELTIEFPESLNGAISINIYSVNGQKVFSQPGQTGLNKLNLSALSKGTYLCQIGMSAEVITKKLIIR